jgi:hypothetical protein
MDNIPLVMAGKGGGTIQSAGKVLNLGGASLASVHLTVAKKLGANIQSFGRVGQTNGDANHGYTSDDNPAAVTQTISSL